MTNYIAYRLVRTLFVILALTLMVFVVLTASGDPARIMLPPYATAEQTAELRRALGLDQPLHVRYLAFLGRMVQGDFGSSIVFKQPALGLVLQHLPATFELTFTALVLSIACGFPLGIAGAVHEGTAIDGLTMTLGVVGRTVPGFLLGTLLILLFSVTLGWLPTSGRGSIRHLIMPGATLATGFIAQIVLLVRTGMLDVLREDYVRTARAKGAPERVVLHRHALRNALVSVVTLIGLRFGTLMGGAVITEAVFSWPGVGWLATSAVSARDFPLVSATVIVLAVWIVFTNLIVDVTYAFLDPRISYGKNTTL